MTLYTYISQYTSMPPYRAALLFIALFFFVVSAEAAAFEGDLDPPTSNGIADISVFEDAADQVINLFDVFEDDIDLDTDLTYTIVSNNNPTLITTTIDGALGILVVSLSPNEFGTAEITVRATDTGAEFTDETFLVTVTSVNDIPTFNVSTPPSANEDTGAQTVLNLATAISAGPANESAQALTFAVTANTNPGLFSVAPTVSSLGTLSYTLAPDLFGSAVITLVLSDDGGTLNGGVDQSIAQNFTITINDVNDEPSFTKGGNINVDEDSGSFSQSNWATGISAGTNESGQTLTFNLSPTNTNLFSVQPTITSTGTLSFTPALNASGTSTVTVSIMDDGGTANGGDNESPSQTFTITIDGVNDRPTTSGIGNQTDLEDAGNRVINLFSSFDDVEDSDASLTYQELSNSNSAIFTSSTINAAAGTYTLDYAPDANGSSVITIRVTDTQGEFVDETFTVTLNAVNDEPSFTKGADRVVSEDAAFQTDVGWATGISAGPVNEASQTLTFDVTADNAGLFQSGPNISSTGTLTYHPAANASGVATITVTLTDNGGTSNGGDNQSPSQTFTITINGQNDEPTSSSIANVQVVEDAANQLIDLFSAFDDIEDNDTQLSYALITNTNAALFGTIPPIGSSDGILTLPFAQNASGTSVLTVRATDSGGLFVEESFTVEVLPVNDAPTFTSGGNVIIPEDSAPYAAPWATNISPGPTNELNQGVTFNLIVSDPTLFDVQPTISPTGVLSFTAKAEVSGQASITTTLQDNGGTANGGIDVSPEIVFLIDISAQNDPPVAIDDAYTVLEGASLTATPGGSPPGVLDNDLDPDGDVLTAVIVQPPQNSTSFSLLGNGTLFYVHDGSENITDTITYYATDGTEDSNIATITISIKESNDPPVAGNINDIIAAEDGPLQLVDLFASFEDPDDSDDALTYSVTNTTNASLFENLIINAETGKLELIYAEDANGSSDVTVQASDPGGLSASATFKVTLTPVNDPPSMTPGPDITLDEDPGPQTISGWAQNLVAGPPDEAGQTITSSVIVSNPSLFSAQPTLTRSGNSGTLTFTPAPQVDGQSSVSITLTDNGGGANSATYDFLITIQGDNDKPTSLTIEDIEVNEDAPTITFNLFDYFTDVEDADADLTFSLEGNFNSDLFDVLSIEGTPKILTINYAADAFGETTIGIRATDSGGLFAQEDVNIKINPVNDAPSFTAGDDVAVGQNSPEFSAAWAEDISIGPENESSQEAFFTVTITNGQETLFAEQPAISSTGELTFTPAIGDQVFGDANVSVILSDNGGNENGGVSQSAVSTFTISIRRLNTAPVGNADTYIVDQGQILQVNAPNGVLANDTDAENDNLTVRLIAEPVNATSFTLNADGSFTYRHNNSSSTNDAFTYVANDGFDDSDITTVAISIQPSGTLALSEIIVLEDAEPSVINIRSALSLFDDGYEFTISNVSNPTVFTTTEIDTLAGILTVTYAPNQNGEANINLVATPTVGDPVFATQKFTIIALNDEPIAVDDIAATIQNRAIEINVISNDVDFDNDDLTIFRITNPAEGSVQAQPNGNLLYTPENDFTGVTSFTYSIRDDSLASAEGIVTITVFSGRFVVSEMGLANSTTSAAYNISNAGEVVGATTTTGGTIQAFSSNQEISFDTASEALDANDFGQIVGATSFPGTGNGGPVFQATLWDTSGVNNLGSFDGRSSKAYSINNAAQIVGISTKENSEVLHALIWNNGGLQELEAAETEESQAFDINEQGLIAGYTGGSATLWRDAKIERRLIGAEGRAYAINASGQTAGSIDDGIVKAMFWNDNGISTILHMDGSSFSEAYGINNATWVVGTYLPVSSGKTSTTTRARQSDILSGDMLGQFAQKKNGKSAGSPTDQAQQINNDMRAFLWQGDTIVDLNEFIDAASGWTLLEARAINNAAQITGIGLLNGERQAFLLSPTLNKTPTATADMISLTALEPITVNVVANDIDQDGDSLRVVSVTQGQFGQVTLEDNFDVTYYPGSDFTNADSFTYTVTDGKGGLAEGTVDILIAAAGLPQQFTLEQNYPNPFNPQTTITFGLPERSDVRIDIYNLLGQRVTTLIDGIKAAGTHTVVFKADNLPGGVYIYRLKTTQYEKSRQLILLK